MVNTVADITYKDLSLALQEAGFEEREREGSRLYRHRQTPDAFISYPALPLSEPVRLFHLIAAQTTIEDFGIMDPKDFDLILLRLTQGASTEAITAP